MNQDEHDMLVRCDESIDDVKARHLVCTIPCRVASLEKDRDRISGALLLIAAITTFNTLVDLLLKFIFHKSS